MSFRDPNWRPVATRAVLEQRAQALACVRAFFAQRAVLEVDTPVIVNSAVTDVHIHSVEVHFPGQPRRLYLHTSPEYAMKRLLASGSGDIFQICHVARGYERGQYHNPEFTLIEWYRLGFSLEHLMDEVEALARAVLGPVAQPMRCERLSYVDAFQKALGIDPLTVSLQELRWRAEEAGLPRAVARTAEGAASTRAAAEAPDSGKASTLAAAATPDVGTRDYLLDFLMATQIGPALGKGALTFIHRYPASQAALARLDSRDPRVALRFELYCEGIELANGFHELASASEQHARFEQDLIERRRAGQTVHEIDQLLLSALEAGLPECAGVAVGFDRLLMLATGARSIDEVLPFPTERA